MKIWNIITTYVHMHFDVKLATAQHFPSHSSIGFTKMGTFKGSVGRCVMAFCWHSTGGSCFLMTRARGYASSMSTPTKTTHKILTLYAPHRRAPPRLLLLPFLRLPSPSDSCSCSSRSSSSRFCSSFNFPSRWSNSFWAHSRPKMIYLSPIRKKCI